MRRKLTHILFALYLLALVSAEWWPFDFSHPDPAKSFFGTFEPFWLRQRDLLEKNVLKLSLFIPIGILFAVMQGRQPARRRVLVQALLLGAGSSILMQTGRYFLPERTFGLSDVLMCAGGALLGAAVIYLQYLSRRTLAILTVGCTSAFIVAATWPGRFSLQAASLDVLARRVEWSPLPGEFSFYLLKERALNGLMMMPLGLLGATYALCDRTVRRALVFTTLLGLSSSVCVELLQCFLPYRTPSLSDILLNTLGTIAGGIVAVYLERSITIQKRI